jgi:hypothetical protein
VIHIEKGTEIFPQEKLHFVGLQLNKRRTAHGVLAIRPGMITFVKHPHRTRVYDSWELPIAAGPTGVIVYTTDAFDLMETRVDPRLVLEQYKAITVSICSLEVSRTV